MPNTLATVIATAVALGWILLMVCAAVLIGHLFAGPPEVMLADTFVEHEDEPQWDDVAEHVAARIADGPVVLAEDPPVVRLYLERDDGRFLSPATNTKDLHRLCIVAYADRRYSDICKGCTPRMGVRP